MFRGSIPALVTPFRNGAVDDKAFVALIERQIKAGSGALVPCGTTGESNTLLHAARELLRVGSLEPVQTNDIEGLAATRGALGRLNVSGLQWRFHVLLNS